MDSMKINKFKRRSSCALSSPVFGLIKFKNCSTSLGYPHIDFVFLNLFTGDKKDDISFKVSAFKEYR